MSIYQVPISEPSNVHSFCHLILAKACEVGKILHMEKLRLRKVKEFAKGHITSNCFFLLQSWCCSTLCHALSSVVFESISFYLSNFDSGSNDLSSLL